MQYNLNTSLIMLLCTGAFLSQNPAEEANAKNAVMSVSVSTSESSGSNSLFWGWSWRRA